MSGPIILEAPVGTDLHRLALRLRHRVFVLEQGVPAELENDALDPAATHIVACDAGEVVGTLRLLFLPEHVKIGRVAIAREARRKGIATQMLRFAMELARTRGETRFYLTAQSDKLTLYEKLGFTAYGDEFVEAGMPHRAMKTY